jgi:hypothetical protein
MKNCIITVFVAGVLCCGAILAGCNKDETENYTSDAVADYMNLEVGKYILYRLDSMRFDNFGQTEVTVSYNAKDVVDGTLTDNLGRSGYRIVRYLRDTASTNDHDWTPILTYQVYPTRENVEVVEGGFRYVKLALPVKEGYSWKGNGYLPSSPYANLFEFSNDEDIQTWDYTYQDVGVTSSYFNKNYDSTLTAFQIADSSGVPIIANLPASKTVWFEKYAKHVGLVYKEVVMWEFQPAVGNTPSYRHGFGLKLTILDHN